MQNTHYIDQNLSEGFNPFEDTNHSLFKEPNEKVNIDWNLSEGEIEMRKFNLESLTTY